MAFRNTWVRAATAASPALTPPLSRAPVLLQKALSLLSAQKKLDPALIPESAAAAPLGDGCKDAAHSDIDVSSLNDASCQN